MEMNQMPPLGKVGETMGRMGRMGDTTLVHMNPQEVQGLSSLGQLTYNPVTGLPEAFNFKNLIGPIAGNIAFSTGESTFKGFDGTNWQDLH